MPRVRAHSAVRLLALLAAATALTGLLAGCTGATATPSGDVPGWPLGQSGSGPLPVIASSELVVGSNRFLYTIVDAANNPIAAPSLATTVRFFDLDRDPARAVTTAPGRFLWAIPNERGYYVANVSFEAAGNWGVEVATSGSGATGSPANGTTRLRFTVQAKSTTIAVGQKAPASKSATLASVGGNVAAVSTDSSPDPRFYETSVADAEAAGKPFLLIFATPAFCHSKVCGPTLDEVKAIAAKEPGFTFINVEPYKMEFTGGRLQPVLDAQGNLQPDATADEWKLQQEPWIFVVDRTGVVRYSFEALASPDELTAAIDAVK